MTVADAFPASLSTGAILAAVQGFFLNPEVARIIVTIFSVAISGWFVKKIREMMDAGWERRKTQFSKVKSGVKRAVGKSGSKS